MAITYDYSTGVNFNASSVTFDHTVTQSGFNKALFVSVGTHSNTVTGNSVTYAGQNLTFVRRDNNATVIGIETWYLLNPTTGTNSVIVTLSATSKSVAGSVSYLGVQQAVPGIIGTQDFLSGTDVSVTKPQITITTTKSNSFIYDALAVRDGQSSTPITASGNQIQRWRNGTDGGAGSSNTTCAVSDLRASGTGSYTVGEIVGSSTNNFAYHVLEIVPAGNNAQGQIFA